MTETVPEPASETQKTLAVSLGFAVVALLSRLPFVSPVLWDHDSVQFALGVGNFDLEAHQPHPPGYPLYVGVLKLLAAVGLEPGAAMSGLAVLSSAVGAFLAVRLGAALARDSSQPRAAAWAGAAAGVLYVTNPMLWFYSELPLVYAVEAATCVAIALACYNLANGGSSFVVGCALFALAGGLRPSTVVLLAPLFLVSSVVGWRRGRLRGRTLVAGGAALITAGLAWGLPLIAAAGGLEQYREISGAHFRTLLPQTSVLYGAGASALGHHLELLVKWTLQGFLPAGCLLAGGALLAPVELAGGLRQVVRRAGFFVLWALPPLLFFLLFHITKAGYTLIYQPCLFIAAALGVAPALYRRPRAATILLTVVAAGSAGMFVFGERRDPQQGKGWAVVHQEFNAGRIRRFAAELGELRTLIREHSEGETLLLALELPGRVSSGSERFLYSWHRHLQWYFPDHRVALLLPSEGRVLATLGAQPFTPIGGRIPIRAEGADALLVLAATPDRRFPLPGDAVVLHEGTSFFVAKIRLTPGSRLGPFLVTAARGVLQEEGDFFEVDAHVDVLQPDVRLTLEQNRG